MGFNLQELMTSNSIILTGLLSQLPNDSAVLKEVEQKVKKKFQNSRKTTKRLWRTLELQTTKKIIPRIRRILRFRLRRRRKHRIHTNINNKLHSHDKKIFKTNK